MTPSVVDGRVGRQPSGEVSRTGKANQRHMLLSPWRAQDSRRLAFTAQRDGWYSRDKMKKSSVVSALVPGVVPSRGRTRNHDHCKDMVSQMRTNSGLGSSKVKMDLC